MNNYVGAVRQRNRNLLIVEGNHEKNELFWLIFKCFPEININVDDIWIYGTNIYLLYDDIVREYGSEWFEDDVDLPFIISRKQGLGKVRYKSDFTNIILVFDYERHDINFSEEKILVMQNYFKEASDTGKLYINYPMIESYQHFTQLPDLEFSERKIPVSLQPGKKYKALVKNESIIAKATAFPHKLERLLNEHFEIGDEQIGRGCTEFILNISDMNQMDTLIQSGLQDLIEERRLKTAKYQIMNMILKLGYIHIGQSYWQYMRGVFQQIIYHNICKAKKIQYGSFQMKDSDYKTSYENIDLAEVLKLQNHLSKDLNNGFIWVLNTSIFLVADYNFGLVVE